MELAAHWHRCQNLSKKRVNTSLLYRERDDPVKDRLANCLLLIRRERRQMSSACGKTLCLPASSTTSRNMTCYRPSREESHLPNRAARVDCSSGERDCRSRSSFDTCEARALSISLRPCSVNSTRMPRRSSGSGIRLTRPFSVSRSIRLVIVPDVTIIERKSSVGESWYGAPDRRRVANISKLQWFKPNCAKTGSSSLSTTSDSREMRPTIPIGETSRSGRSTAHWARMLLT